MHSCITHTRTRVSLCTALLLLLGGIVVQRASAQPITLEELEGKVRIEINGQLFTEYVYRDCENPYLYPVIGPHEIGMTRNYPMREVPGESQDHQHHTSIWFAHDGINGVDFWRSAKPGHGKTVQDEIVRTEVFRPDGSPELGLLETTNRWQGPDGTVVCRDRRKISFMVLPAGRAIDWEITLLASEGDVTIMDTEEGSMAVRSHPNLRLENDEEDGVTTANGKSLNSTGVRGEAVWGKRAKWIDYWGVVDGKTVGIAVFDHPKNLRHPTWWHARPYGLFAANPFGIHDFEDKPAGAGDVRIRAGESLTLRYRIILHEGTPEEAQIEQQYAIYQQHVPFEESF